MGRETRFPIRAILDEVFSGVIHRNKIKVRFCSRLVNHCFEKEGKTHATGKRAAAETFAENVSSTKRGLEWWVDLGAGSGFFTELLKQKVPNAAVVQLDVRSVRGSRGMRVRGDVRFLPFRGVSFDGGLCSQVMHYFSFRERREILRGISRILEGGGVLVVIEYNTSGRFSWIPYPLPLEEFAEEVRGFSGFVLRGMVEADLDYRPKYALYLEKTGGGEAEASLGDWRG